MPLLDTQPPLRRLTVFAQDPNVRSRGKILTAKVEVPTEYLRKGPAGHRVHVIDYDTSTDRLLAPGLVDDADQFADVDPNTLVDNPYFHAQNVYAIAMATLSHFERALGRRVQWGFAGHQIKIAPHAFADANAYYSRDDEALMFGYFPASSGTVFTCVSHDIVAHETAHALIDGLRRHYLLPSSPQQAAFHEGFADVVALLSVFKLPGVVDAVLKPADEHVDKALVIQKSALTVARLRETALITLADQMGEELTGVRGNALRKSAELSRSDHHVKRLTEPHDLGEVLVAAMLNAFLEVWVRRLFPYGSRGVQALDRSHVVTEGAAAAEHLLTMAIRAIDYAPPVDLQFGDFLSALLTADTEVHPDDTKYRYREVLTRVFEEYGISPAAKAWGSNSGLWMPPEHEVDYGGTSHQEMQRDPEAAFRFVWQNRDALRLEPNAYTYVESVRPTVRTNTSGFILHETVVEYVQILGIRADELALYGLEKPNGMNDWQRVKLYGGGALVFNDRGRLKLNVGSGVTSQRQNDRLRYLFDEGYFDVSGANPVDLARLHRIRSGAPSLEDPYLPRRDER
jgi:hypothetical protein